MEKTIWLITIATFLPIFDNAGACHVIKQNIENKMCANFGWGSCTGWPPKPCCPGGGGSCGSCGSGGTGGGVWGGGKRGGWDDWGGGSYKRSGKLKQSRISTEDIPSNSAIPHVEQPSTKDTRPKFLATIATAFEEPVCTAPIISSHFVMSSCIRCLQENGKSVHPGQVRVMVVDTPNKDAKSTVFNVYEAQTVLIHPGCIQQGNYDLKHDIGLVQTADKINLTPNVVPAKLPKMKALRSSHAKEWMVAAYTAEKSLVKSVKDAVAFVKVPSINSAACTQVLNSTFYNETFNYCAPYQHKGGIDNCDDDFGAALAAENTVYGLLIHKHFCGKPGSAASFVSVPYNSKWIKKSVAELSKGQEDVRR